MSEEFQTWKQHFIDQAKGLIPYQKKFYKVSMQQGGGEKPTIKIISPTEQIVERAKSNLDNPPSLYDPVTGVMQNTRGKHVKANSLKQKRKYKSRKRLIKSKSRKGSKKRTQTRKKRKNVRGKEVKKNKSSKRGKWI